MSEREATVEAAPDQGWKTARERGGVLGMRFVLWLTTAFGRGPARLFVRVLAFYYTVFAGGARRTTAEFLQRVEGRSSFSRVYLQILRFAQVTLDSLFFVSGKIEPFELTRSGSEHLERLRETGEGGILLGAHLGSMHALRARGTQANMPVYAVVYTQHAERINAVLREVNPDGQASLLQMGEGVDFMLRIKELIESGAIIAILADRVGADGRAVEADFFGARARFPAGPYILAAMLKCPVYLTFGLYRAPSRYDLYVEPFAERIVLPRKRRQEALSEYVQAYAARLEHYVSMAPDNWFNFYDFWGKPT